MKIYAIFMLPAVLAMVTAEIVPGLNKTQEEDVHSSINIVDSSKDKQLTKKADILTTDSKKSNTNLTTLTNDASITSQMNKSVSTIAEISQIHEKDDSTNDTYSNKIEIKPMKNGEHVNQTGKYLQGVPLYGYSNAAPQYQVPIYNYPGYGPPVLVSPIYDQRIELQYAQDFYIRPTSPPLPILTTTNRPEPLPSPPIIHKNIELKVFGEVEEIKSPGYPQNYLSFFNNSYKYTITSPKQSTIQMNCEDFHFPSNPDDASFIVTDGFKKNAIFYGQNPIFFKSSKNNVTVIFKNTMRKFSTDLYRFSCSFQAKKTICNCGRRLKNFHSIQPIVGGLPALPHEFPWRVLLEVPAFTENKGYFIEFCGGTILSNNWIMTASHCFGHATGVPVNVFAGINEVPLDSEGLSALGSIKSKRIILHQLYTRVESGYDIAVIELETALQFNETLMPGCLPWNLKEKYVNNSTVVASGWGLIDQKAELSNNSLLLKADLTLMLRQSCQMQIQNIGGVFTLPQSVICTLDKTKDTCQGDSGGSIDFEEAQTNKYLSIGVVSYGFGCLNEHMAPSVYTEVTEYLSWIEETTGVDFCKD